MRVSPAAIVTLALLVGVAGLHVRHGCAEEPAAPAAPAPFDRVRVRQALLARMDAKIDADAARAHLEARVLLDETMPLPYLGIDADPAPGGMKVTKVYPLTGAEAAGLREGDVVTSVDGRPTPDVPALGLAIRAHDVGDTLRFRFLRDGKETEVATTLGRRPEEDEDEDEQFAYAREGSAPGAPAPRTFDFAGPEGGLPEGLEAVLGGHGRAPAFVVRKDAAGTFLRQTDDDPTGIRFPMAWVRDFAAHDVRASVRFRFVAGRQDRAAGIVVRGETPWTYLVARVNAVEGDLRIFRVAHGLRRTILGAKVKADVADGGWHTLEVTAQGPRLTASVDGKATAAGYDTYVRGGRVGLWTKSDSVTDFDDFAVAPIVPREGEVPEGK
jgi:hypothetical protein